MKGEAMKKLVDEALLLDAAYEPGQAVVAVAGGVAIAYTCKCPEKETENEDSVAIVPYGPDAVVLVVADGAGGLPAGKRASLTAVTTLADSLRASRQQATLLRTAILNGIEAANDAVLAFGNGSATTMTVVAVEDHFARSFQIGDSEAIVVGQRGRVRLQTTAHSPTGFAVEAGFLDEREALHHADRHLVSNLIGMSNMRVDVGAAVRLNQRDTIMIASDGLMDNVHVGEIIERIRKGPLEEAMERTVTLAAQRMRNFGSSQPSKPDDLSLILFRDPRRRATSGNQRLNG
ncbi:MAG: protein phosphatase 2C domain-containing protein [Gammaproteobacteria bacterium]|nr:protein phosphatase 2C domain-containing protein [Gammaproteobacteria bacterium]